MRDELNFVGTNYRRGQPNPAKWHASFKKTITRRRAQRKHAAHFEVRREELYWACSQKDVELIVPAIVRYKAAKAKLA